LKSPSKSRLDYFSYYLAKAPIAMALWRALECHRFSFEKLEHPVLDVGCGDGFVAHMAFGEILEAGIDLDPQEVVLAEKSGSYRKAVCASATEIPFPDRSFKTVVSNCVMEHIPDIDLALREIRRVLKPKGRLMITVPSEQFNRSYFRQRLEKIGLSGLGKWYIDKLNLVFKHFHVDDSKTWETRMEKAGLKVITIDYIIPLKTFRVYERYMFLAFPSKVWKNLFDRRTLFPRWPIKAFATWWLKDTLNAEGDPGAGYFIVAQKE
jgi:ubiquinone/menaquinone biosynthesis C-methylase UbiE